MMRLYGLAVGVVLSFAMNVNAGVITYTFGGIVDFAGGSPLPASVTSGASFTGTLSYIDSVVDQSFGLNVGTYDYKPFTSPQQQLSINVTVANALVMNRPAGTNGHSMVGVYDGTNTPVYDDTIAFRRNEGGFRWTDIYLMDGVAETAVTGDKLAGRVINLEDFVVRKLEMIEETWSLHGTLTSFTLLNKTDSTAVAGGASNTSVLGGTSVSGGVAIAANAATAGSFSAVYSEPTYAAFLEDWNSTNGFSAADFLLYGNDDPTAGLQAWDLSFTGSLSGNAILQFTYDDSRLSDYYRANESLLGIWHFNSATQSWEFLRDGVDTQNNIITVSVNNFSPFILGRGPAVAEVPEPSSLVLMTLGGLTGLGYRLRRRSAA